MHLNACVFAVFRTVPNDVHGVPKIFVLGQPADDVPTVNGIDVDGFFQSQMLQSNRKPEQCIGIRLRYVLDPGAMPPYLLEPKFRPTACMFYT